MGYRGHVGFSYGQIRKAQKVHARRSKRAKLIDENLKAPIAKSPEQWLAQPNRFDFPDVDTPNTVSKKEQARRLEELRAWKARQSSTPTNHSRFMSNLNAHKLSGNIH